MIKKDKNKKYIEYKKSYPQQLDLFSFSNVFDSMGKEKYSGTVELYDVVPKYYLGDLVNIRTEEGLLKPITREFEFRKQKMFINISPAFVFDKNNKSKAFFPSQREEIIEDVLRKFATNPYRNEFLDERLSVRFTLYELWLELRKIKHGCDYEEIRESLEILAGTNLKIKTGDDKVTFSSNMFETFGIVDQNENSDTDKESEEHNKKITYFVRFNSLVTDSIKNKTWRIINYDQCMAYRKAISRWLHKRISHMFLCNKIELPYNIRLSTIIRDSGMTEYKQLRDSVIQVKKCLDEMISVGSIFKYEIEKIFSKEKSNKIEDIKFLIYISKSFFDDMRLGNLALFDSDKIKQIQEDSKVKYKEDNNNQNFPSTNKENEIESENKEDVNSDFRTNFKKEIIEIANSLFLKNNITSLSDNDIEKIIDKTLNSLSTITVETKDTLIANINACIGYIKKQISNNKKHNDIAILTKSIKENWRPNETDNSKPTTIPLSEEELKKQNQNLIEQQANGNEDFRKIAKALSSHFGRDTYSCWLANIKFISIDDNQFNVSVETMFIKEWIEKNFLKGSKKKVDGETVWLRKGMLQVVQDLYPNITKIEIKVIS
ncbi:MAG: DnaA N-terminal domain-containing protein [Rickettsiales bacterium]|nr:DnaA N-terminal domain-containing protein [Rickettsiales bacterium]